ncbi:hypothetical protein EYR40_000101 [Pleurotus pulmonarius]|nr:hypothetical protein EYR40_000101 [Pleurotus pulmonarius]
MAEGSDMSGRWIGPCAIDKFFKLAMAKKFTRKRREKLPKIDKKFFARKKPASAEAMTQTFMEFFGRDNFPGIKLVQSPARPEPDSEFESESEHGLKVRPVSINVHEERSTAEFDGPTLLSEALAGVEIDNKRIDLFNDDEDDEPFEDDSHVAKRTRDQLAAYAVDLCARQHRTHLFIVYISYPCARLIRFDRAGALVSERFKFTRDCTPLIRFFSRFSKMTPAGRGYDPTVRVADERETRLAHERLKAWAPGSGSERPVFNMEVYDDTMRVGGTKGKKARPRNFLVWGSFADPDRWPLGRATRGYPALEVTDGVENVPREAPIMFLKEQWRSTVLRQEIDILRELNDKGVEHVPTLLCGGVLPGQVTQTGMYATKIKRRGGKNIAERAHVRFVVLEVGRPLERFSSSKEMFKAVFDAFQGHKQAFEKCSLLHRDVSGGNILLLTNGGLLIDWDMAVKADGEEYGTTSGPSERVGTWDFMSMDLLSSSRHPHKISDDLESFFWVLLYYSLHFLHHNKVDKLKEIIHIVFEQYTDYGEVVGGQGKRVTVMGGWHIGFDGCPRLEFTGNKPLTRISPSLLIDCSDPLPSLPPPPTQKQRQDDVELFFKSALDMSWPTDDASKVYGVKGPKDGQVAAADTESGESTKRKHTTQDDPVEDSEDRPLKRARCFTQEALSLSAKDQEEFMVIRICPKVFASGTFIPAIPQIAHDLATSPEIVTLTISMSIFGTALGSMAMATYSGFYGRRPVYLAGLPVFCLGSYQIAISQNIYYLIAWRFIQNVGISGGISLGAGVIGDIYKLEERGFAMGVFFGGVLLGPAIAPVTGGIATHYASWRMLQWGFLICGLALLISMALWLPETSHPGTLGVEKAEDQQPHGVLLVPLAYTIGAKYGITNEALIGAVFIPCGVGNMVGAPLAGYISDQIIVAYRAKRGGDWYPEDRLRGTLLGAAFCVPLSVLFTGLTIVYVPGRMGLFLCLVWLFMNGIGVDLVLSPSSAYNVDVVHTRSAEVMAANRRVDTSTSIYLSSVSSRL